MRITHLLGFSSKCPQCEKVFFKPLVVKGLIFCPNCKKHLRLQENLLKIKPLMVWWKRLFISIVTSGLVTCFVFLDFLHVPIVFTHYTLLLVLVFGLGWLGIAVALKRYYLLQDKTLVLGTDILDKVKNDYCPEYKFRAITRLGVQDLLCSNCCSMRLSDKYWYKQSQATRGASTSSLINEIDSEAFLGCLNCFKVYEKQKDQFPFKLFIQVMLIILLTTFMLIVVLRVIFIYADSIESFLPPKFIVLFVVLTAYSYTVMSTSKHHRLEPVVLIERF